ncbi:MAG: hypothetical protein A2176_13970 [Spirochaetes bacterium RBG_13_51_14]|nr:MAG: hypothetical protein A2176_13970 [Spirochaetes bacterium RBG_13_51_14]
MADEKRREETSERSVDALLSEIIDFIDFNTFNKIINKLTDYAEILSEGKISGIINFNFHLNSNQTGTVVKILEDIQAITRIYNLALKGSKDLEIEYISNIFSDFDNPESISSYVNLKNIIENRLTHQVQQYNINMGKNNTTMAIPLNELRGHVKTFRDLREMQLAISTKAQHGIIAASLHDAYTTLLNRPEYWNERTYMKFFFNEDDLSKKKILLIKRDRGLTISEIGNKVRETLDKLHAIMYNRMQTTRESVPGDSVLFPDNSTKRVRTNTFTDRMMLTPFGRQYGSLIEKIITGIFNPEMRETAHDIPEESIREKVALLFQAFKLRSDMTKLGSDALDVVDYLLVQDYGIKTFAEKFLYFDRKESFSKFYSGQTQEQIDLFLTKVFIVYFEERFSNLFKIIKSMDMKKFACAFIIKRIYLREGESLSNFGFLFIRVIAKSGGIKSQ